ncbi:MAG: 4-coumarate--CoA ligase, partial [Sphingomonadales bacterium]
MRAMSHEMMKNRLAEPFGSFPDLLMEWSRLKGDDLALRDERREVYWAELVGLVERLAARLVETGLQRGQSVAILGTSTVEYALVFLAAVRAGGVAAPLTTSASPEQLEGMAKDSGAIHLFIDSAKAAELGPD